jgi:integrase
MKHITTKTNPFLGHIPTVTLAEVMDLVSADMIGTAQRDTLSALRSLAKFAGLEVATTRADAAMLRAAFEHLNEDRLGLTAKRLANIRSLSKSAIERFGTPRSWPGANAIRTPEWQDLMALVDKRERHWTLGRLATFASAGGIAPGDVNRDVLRDFFAALEEDPRVSKPRVTLKQILFAWNTCHRDIVGWPPFRLASPFKTTPYMLPLASFPKTFQEEVEAFCRYLRMPDPLDPHAPLRAYRTATIDGYVLTFRRLASALVRTGTIAQEDVFGLAVLCTPEHLKAALRPYIPRGTDHTYEYPHKMAVHITFVARQYLQMNEEMVTPIRLITSRLGENLTSGMGKRNKSRLAPFDDPIIVQRLLSYPMAERDRALRKRNPKRRAKGIERALLASLLINTGLRVQSLRWLQYANHFRFTPREVFLELQEEDTKTHSAHSLSLPKETVELLELFATEHRKLLPGSDGPYLFPGEQGGMRHASSLRNAVGPHIKKHLGINVSPHLFRHIVAKIVMEHDPGMLADISRRLGHKSINTTYGTYLGTETPAASRRINALLEDMQRKQE